MGPMRQTVGLMSGTSLDGVDAAWVETDGERVARFGPALTLPYDDQLRADLRALLDRAASGVDPDDAALRDAERRLTARHVDAVAAVIAAAGARPALIGLHGQTILHRPARRVTWQIGDAAALAAATGIAVAHDFRGADVAAGGQGAPLAPALHAALARDLPKPVAVLNLGGVGNVTWIGAGGALLAFDTGPANGPLDDLARRATGAACDRDGALAQAGRAEPAVLAALLAHPYLAARPPKSLDRLDFDRAIAAAGVPALSLEDAAATLTAFAAGCVAAAAALLPEPPRRWLVTGGGRRNPALMAALAAVLPAPVDAVESVGWDGDALEAQAFGLLAVRVARGLPLSWPGTTGVPAPWPGGRIVYPAGVAVTARQSR